MALESGWDPVSLRRANPPRGSRIPLMPPGEALKRVSKLMRTASSELDPSAAPPQRGARTAALRALDAVVDWGDEDGYDAIAVWAGETMGPAGALEAFAFEHELRHKPGLPFYSYMAVDRWLSLARVLSESSEGDYLEARAAAEALRKSVPDQIGFACAIAMLFPSEPWANEVAATFDRKRWNGIGDIWEAKLAAVMHSVSDWPLAERLMGELVKTGTWSAPPAYALAFRFGPAAIPLLVAAAEANGSEEELTWIYGALGCLADPAVAAFLGSRTGRLGKQAAAAWFKRFPSMRKAKGKPPRRTSALPALERRWKSASSPLEDPEPSSEAALERTRKAAPFALSPTMEALLRADASYLRGLGWLDAMGNLRAVPVMDLVREHSEVFAPAFEPMVEAFLPGLGLPLDQGSDSMRFLYLGAPDGYGEYPALFIDVDDEPLLGVECGGFDVWLAEQFGVSVEDSLDRKAGAEKRLFGKPGRTLSASEFASTSPGKPTARKRGK